MNLVFEIRKRQREKVAVSDARMILEHALTDIKPINLY